MWAIIERELRRFRRSPVLIVISLIFPIVQLVVLGYAFGGNVKHLKLAIVDQDHGVPAVKIRELASALASGARTIDTFDYADPGQALNDLRNGRVNGVLTIPPEFSRRVLARTIRESRSSNNPTPSSRDHDRRRRRPRRRLQHADDHGGARLRRTNLDVVEVYPCDAVSVLLPGSMSRSSLW
jgi:ABC-type Na+ efflux pump permease subunit